jgi:hypothetical protein
MEAQDDPFDSVVYSSSLVIDLTGTEDELHAALAATLKVEGKLFAHGLVCELKHQGQDCLSCPSSHIDPAERLSRLCRLGKDQFNIMGRLEDRRQARIAPLVELGRSVEEYVELAEAMA